MSYMFKEFEIYKNIKRKYMIIRTLLLALTFIIPLSATQENKELSSNPDEIFIEKCASACASCRDQPSAAALYQGVQAVLDFNILLLPQLQPQLVAQLNQIVTNGGIGIVGATGPAGPAGATGATGATGTSGIGGVLDFADFFALMPPDNAATVAPGTDVSFPQDGPTSSGGITRVGPSSFNLASIGSYQVFFQVSVTEAGQFILTLNGADLTYTVVGRATGTSQIIGLAIVQTTVINSVLTVRNPAGNSTALTITPLAGGTRPVSAHLVITRLQ